MQPNAHVHPAFAGVLNSFAAIPQQVAAARAVKCRVTAKTEDGEQTYDGLFPSTCDAVIDAAERVGLPCKVSARAIK
ncbi:hypothetical protein [Pandoraea sp. CB10b_02]|uniref:hypothetical protein n=1 Tax=Pandoraea sp. CB10b_02 TaxID=2014535 RepID=UPI00258086AB|nr:hypothetical protein [Pandoraea sp. CB10b_02]